MASLLDLFRSFTAAHGIEAYLVGGAVRDLLLGQEVRDADIAVQGDSLELAAWFSRETEATFVLLDREWGTGRVVRGVEQLDISPLRGGSVETDLAGRDLTVNAMAISLSGTEELTAKASVIDPLGGRTDISQRLIRMVSEENLRKDPLRLLRVYRFSAALSFSITEETGEAVRRLAPLISSPAPERVAAEMRLILGLPSSHRTIRNMLENGLFMHLFPELREKVSPSGEKILLILQQAEEIMLYPARFLGKEGLQTSRLLTPFRQVCLKLALFFGEPETSLAICRRMKLSGKETRLIHSLLSHQQTLTGIVREETASGGQEKIIPLLQALEDEVHTLAVLCLASSFHPGAGLPPDKATSLCRELLSLYHGQFQQRKALLPLLTGDDLRKELSLTPSPLFRVLLSQVERAVLSGVIRTREEALVLARETLRKGEAL